MVINLLLGTHKSFALVRRNCEVVFFEFAKYAIQRIDTIKCGVNELLTLIVSEVSEDHSSHIGNRRIIRIEIMEHCDNFLRPHFLRVRKSAVIRF